MSPYQKILNELSAAKQSNNLDSIRNAVLSSIAQISELAESKDLGFKTFSDFIYDVGLIFPIEKDELYQDKADLHIISRGILDELLEVIGIKDHYLVSITFRDAIRFLHAAVSCDKVYDKYLTDLKVYMNALNEKIG